MPALDLHDKPFDESTLAKLRIFCDYAQAWLPTFIMTGKYSEVAIFDFFAGTGYDKEGKPGSPIRLLETINSNWAYLTEKKVKVNLHLNEFEPNRVGQKKFEVLKGTVTEYITSVPVLKNLVSVKFYNEDTEVLFPKLKNTIEEQPSLVYFDQNGMLFLSDDYLLELEKMNQTDFIYFVSSSHIGRFGNEEEFRKYLELDIDEMRNHPNRFIHRILVNQLRKRLPVATNLKLYPFSIKKGANIHGIIFGAKHPRAIDKFLDIAWKNNPINGDANFDIDEDQTVAKIQTDLFGNKPLTKLELFEQDLVKKLLNGSLSNNKEVLDYVYHCGHIPKHADSILRKLKDSKKVNYEGTSPYLKYEYVYNLKKKKLLTYQVSKS